MAEKRMFSQKIIDSDAFLDMDMSSQNLYFHLGMRADDDGFINSPKKIARMVGATTTDIETLAKNKFIICFDSGICVIKHWLINNSIRSDRIKETSYLEEKGKLRVKDNKSYTLTTKEENDNQASTKCQPTDNQVTDNGMEVVDIDKIRLDKTRIDKKIFVEDSIEFQLSKFLFEKMLLNNPNAKQPNFQTWARDIDLMIRIDNRQEGDIRKVIEWSQKDSFWLGNILSAKKLRSKFDTLMVRVKGDKVEPVKEIKKDRFKGLTPEEIYFIKKAEAEARGERYGE